MCFQFTHFHCDDCERIYILSYHHHQIGSMNYYPLFRVRSWNNGMRCMSLYSYEIQHKFTNQSKRSSGWQPWNSLRTLKRAFKVSSEYQDCTLMTFPFQWSDVSFGAISILRCHFIAIGIPIINVRRTHDGFIFIMVILCPKKTVFMCWNGALGWGYTMHPQAHESSLPVVRYYIEWTNFSTHSVMAELYVPQCQDQSMGDSIKKCDVFSRKVLFWPLNIGLQYVITSHIQQIWIVQTVYIYEGFYFYVWFMCFVYRLQIDSLISSWL